MFVQILCTAEMYRVILAKGVFVVVWLEVFALIRSG